MGASLFGTFMFVTAVIRSVQEVVNLNLPTTCTKFGGQFVASNEPAKLVAMLRSFTVLSVLTAICAVALVIGLFAYAPDRLMIGPELQNFVAIYAVGSVLFIFDGLCISVLRLHNRFKTESLVLIATDWVDFLLPSSAVLIYPGRLDLLLVAGALALLIKTSAYIVVTRISLRDLFRDESAAGRKLLHPHWPAIWRFILFNSPSNTIAMVARHGDVLLLGALSSAAQVAYYGIAKRLGYFVLRFTDPMMQSIFPQLSKLVSQDRKVEIRALLKRMTGLLSLPMLAGLVLVLPISEWVLALLYGEDYRLATRAMQILLVAGVGGAAFFWTLPAILSLGLVKLRLWLEGLTLLLGGLMGFVLVPQHGAAGMAFALLLSVMVSKAAQVIVTRMALR